MGTETPPLLTRRFSWSLSLPRHRVGPLLFSLLLCALPPLSMVDAAPLLSLRRSAAPVLRVEPARSCPLPPTLLPLAAVTLL